MDETTQNTVPETTMALTPDVGQSATETQSITLQDLQQISLDNIHASLFGSFLLCGAVVACTLFRRR